MFLVIFVVCPFSRLPKFGEHDSILAYAPCVASFIIFDTLTAIFFYHFDDKMTPPAGNLRPRPRF